MAMSDRIAVMNAGRIEQIGTGAEIYRRPATRFVAEFIGEANLLPVRCIGEETVAIMPAGESSGRSLAVLRPEHARLLGGATEPEEQRDLLTLDGRIEQVTSIGGVTNIYVRALGHLVLTRRLGLVEQGLNEGQEVRLGFQPRDLHLLEGARP